MKSLACTALWDADAIMAMINTRYNSKLASGPPKLRNILFLHAQPKNKFRLLLSLPRDAMLSAVYAVVVCLSVSVCVAYVSVTPVLYRNG